MNEVTCYFIHRPLRSHRRGFLMKYSFDDKLKAVKYYLEKGIYLYPDNLKTPSQKHSELERFAFYKAIG